MWACVMLIGPVLGRDGLRYIALAVLVAVGIASYGLFGQMLGAFRLSEFRRTLRRQR